MIYLNILPEEKKAEIKRKKRLKMIIKHEIILFLVFGLFISMLIFNNIILSIELKGIDRAIAFEKEQQGYKDLLEYENKFNDFNKKLSTISNIYDKHLHWTNIFLALSETHERGITITDISTNNYIVSLRGKAKTRDEFLSFQDRMNNNSCFEKVNVPLSNLVQKEHVDFQMDFSIQDECLRMEK